MGATLRKPITRNKQAKACVAPTSTKANKAWRSPTPADGNVETLNRLVEAQQGALDKEGLSFDASDDTHTAHDAHAKLWGDHDNRVLIASVALDFGIPGALLAGTLASEMDLDYERQDQRQDDLAASSFVHLGDAFGIAQVHGETLTTAIDYLTEHKLRGASVAASFDRSVDNLLTMPGAVTSAAIVLAMLVHLKGGGPLSPADMAVVWGGYRAGIQGITAPDDGGGYTQEGFKANTARSDSQGGPPQGKNAWMSQPFFEHFDALWRKDPPVIRGVDEPRSLANFA
jgi:hypothetical protein